MPRRRTKQCAAGKCDWRFKKTDPLGFKVYRCYNCGHEDAAPKIFPAGSARGQ